MPASLAMSRVRVAAKPFWVKSFLAACMIFSSVEMGAPTGVEVFFLVARRTFGADLPDVFLSDLRDAFATGPCFVSGTKIRLILI